MDRRRLLTGCLALPLAGSVRAFARSEIPIGDMHVHLFFVGPKPAVTQPLGANMRAGGATLVSWSLVGDMPWLAPGGGSFRQVGAPRKAEGLAWLEEEAARAKAHCAEQNLELVLDPAGIERALAGNPHVVLSVEGATFLDDGIAALDAAYALGVRHLQLVHFARNPIGDFQTERPQHGGGITAYGREVVAACNRLGILIDLAHATDAVVRDALAISSAPMVWSHSSVTVRGTPDWRSGAWRARQLAVGTAQALAAKGGVVGLWALAGDVGRSVASYADRFIALAELLGEDHVAFGTDMNALAATPIRRFGDHRRVVDRLLAQGLAPDRVRKLAIGNYARVLRTAFESRSR